MRDQLFIECAAFSGELQGQFAAILGILDPLDQLLLQKMRDGAADGRFVRPGALGDILRRAGLVPEAERGHHPPFGNVETIAVPILAGEFGADFRGQPVQPERHEAEKIEFAQGTRPGLMSAG